MESQTRVQLKETHEFIQLRKSEKRKDTRVSTSSSALIIIKRKMERLTIY